MVQTYVLVVLIAAILVKTVTNKSDDIKKTKEKEQPEIVKGDCKEAKDREMVYHEVVQKSDVPFIKRNATSSWFGDHKIYCIKVLNELKRKNKKDGGTALIKEGGVGHNFVTVEMHSQSGEPIEFLVLVYAKKDTTGGKKGAKSTHKKV